MEVLKEDDYQYNVGVKFNVLGWDVDADISYGKDIDNIYTWNCGNRSLFIDTHTTPTNFYDGSFTASQFVGTIDATPCLQCRHGLAADRGDRRRSARRHLWHRRRRSGCPITRKARNPSRASRPAAAGTHSRKNYAGYIDLALAPIEALQLDVAGRAEHYTDFGDAQIGKITARYDFNPQWAIRGTHLDRLPRADPGGRILHRGQRLADLGHRAAAGQLAPPPTCWAWAI